jgi:hypothetical protein
MNSPVNWPDATKLPVAAIADTSDHLIDTVSAYATGHVKIMVGPLVHVAVTGHGRLSAEHNYTDLGDGWFCTKKQGCECPAGSPGTVSTNQPLDLGADLALTGDPADGATADIEAHTLTEFCDGIFIQEGTKGSSTLTQVAHYEPAASCTIGPGDTLTVKVTPKGGELTITVPGFPAFRCAPTERACSSSRRRDDAAPTPCSPEPTTAPATSSRPTRASRSSKAPGTS